MWTYLKSRTSLASHRDDNQLTRESQAIDALKERVAAMEKEMEILRHDAHVYRRIGHDMADVANAARLVLITKFIEVNETLVECGKPEKYPDPVQAAMEAIDKISRAIVGERQALYDRAEQLEEVSQLQRTEIEAKKETVKKSVSEA